MITDALLLTGQVILPIALIAGGYVAGYIHGNISGISPDNAAMLAARGYRIETTVLPRMFGIFFNKNQSNDFKCSYYQRKKAEHQKQIKQLNEDIRILINKPDSVEAMNVRLMYNHIDVMEVAPGAGSQKQYAGRIHCKKMRDLPYEPSHYLTEPEIVEVDEYCENDLSVLESLFDALAPQLRQRLHVGKQYGLDLRSKSDAQMSEAVLKLRCEQVLGQRIYKPNIDWNLKFRYDVPAFVSYQTPQLQRVLELARSAIFGIRPPVSMRGDNGDDGEDGDA